MPWGSVCARWLSAGQKKVKETNAIFAQVKAVHEQAATETQTLRLSLDTKAPVRGGGGGGWCGCTTRRTIANTTRSNGCGGSWRTIGVGSCWIVSKRCWATRRT